MFRCPVENPRPKLPLIICLQLYDLVKQKIQPSCFRVFRCYMKFNPQTISFLSHKETSLIFGEHCTFCMYILLVLICLYDLG